MNWQVTALSLKNYTVPKEITDTYKEIFNYLKEDEAKSIGLKKFHSLDELVSKEMKGKNSQAQAIYHKITSFHFFKESILPYKNLIKYYPDDNEWSAEAQLKIAENFKRFEENLSAEKEYLNMIKEFKSNLEISSKAKIKLAELYWKKMNRFHDAEKLWLELDKKNKY